MFLRPDRVTSHNGVDENIHACNAIIDQICRDLCYLDHQSMAFCFRNLYRQECYSQLIKDVNKGGTTKNSACKTRAMSPGYSSRLIRDLHFE